MRNLQNKGFKVAVWAICFLLFSSCSPHYQGPVSDHFDGDRFFNKAPDHSFTDMVKWWWEMETIEWPAWVEDLTQPPPVDQVTGKQIRVTYINHATVLIQVDGLNILTDPIWSLRAGPVSWLGVKRVRAPGVLMSDLPKIDYILLSHDHFDHLDLPTLRDLIARHNPQILVGLGVKRLMVDQDIMKVEKLDWWQAYQCPKTGNRFVFVPAIHNSGRGPMSGNRTLWGGFIIEGAFGQIYFGGDTGFGDFVYQISSRFKDISLAILPIGSYEKRWFMKSQHMNPEDAVKVHQILGAHQSMGIHYATFAEHPEQTIDAHERDLSEALVKYQIPAEKFWVLKFGEGRQLD